MQLAAYMRRWSAHGWHVIVALLVLCAASQAATNGVSGAFTLVYSRQPAGSAEPSFTMTIPGTFAASASNFMAEATYSMPGGGSENVRLLLLDNAQKLLLLYPETLNYRKIEMQSDLRKLMSTIPKSIGTYFEATPESLQKQGINLISEGRVTIDGDKLLAYKAQMPAGGTPSVKDSSGKEWTLKLYFTPKDKRLRMLQVSTADSRLRLKLANVKRAENKPSIFKVPNGYYETEPLIIGPHGEK
jgi:hypothetical protein